MIKYFRLYFHVKNWKLEFSLNFNQVVKPQAVSDNIEIQTGREMNVLRQQRW